MKRIEIIKQIAKITGVPQHDCTRVLDAFQEVVVNALANGEKVMIRGFLTFTPRTYTERNRFNPDKGVIEKADAFKTVICKIGKPVKEIINNTQREI